MTINTIPTIRIATRASPLALWQAETVAHCLRRHYPNASIVLVPQQTIGDKILDKPLRQIGGKDLFVKALEQTILAGHADIAVHSMKDVGALLPDTFTIAAILPRDDVRDALVSQRYASLVDLPPGAIIGTCAVRRQMQLLHYRDDWQIRDLRGNVNTRLQKLDSGEFDAIILACSGLMRLGLQARIRAPLPITFSLPAIGQGAIGIECLKNSPILPLLSVLNHPETELCVQTERTISRQLGGDCQTPLAALAMLKNNQLTLHARLGSPDGKKMLSFSGTEQPSNANELAFCAVKSLIAQGARDILNALQ